MSLTFGCVLKVNIECLNGDHVGGLEDKFLREGFDSDLVGP